MTAKELLEEKTQLLVSVIKDLEYHKARNKENGRHGEDIAVLERVKEKNTILIQALTLLEKQESGLVVELPVLIGTTVHGFENEICKDYGFCDKPCAGWHEGQHCFNPIPAPIEPYKFSIDLLPLWGKNVFATEEAAEAAKEEKDGNK